MTTQTPGRQIIIDTETTGVDILRDRVAEIAAVEIDNLRPTGRTFHAYVNPGMSMPADATAVHGLTDAMLADKPIFSDTAASLLEFIGDAPLVAHNAKFDVGVLSAELKRCGKPPLANHIIDTLAMARTKHPGAPASLDALCRRYGISTAARVKHGALLDCELLAKVYIDLVGRQAGLELVFVGGDTVGDIVLPTRSVDLPTRLTEAELAAHAAMLAGIPNHIWSHA